MKLTTTLTALFATTTLAMTDLEMCQKKNPHAVQAIQQFCAKTDIVAPSSYATAGAHVGTGGAHDTRLSIEAVCSPAQWVPQKYCLSQYYNMCATGDDVGDANDRFYGAGNYHCQTWHFSVGGPYGGL
ncbi:hypothetical protein B0A54_06926 [Friedmanniomyces endolithicus]|uniref:Uncharacterized protein n=1 Tax=Friedmanniomyces endolithicus TaxID=329885 RepID=A0A4U0V3V9_9PEZI|nr:hypothetical protein B0A54_06926 [Friedmanniomyces endolithicus]